MSDQEKQDLWNSNVVALNALFVSAGSMIKALLIGLRDNGPTYIRLTAPVPGGHVISYVVVEGDPDLVRRVGAALGLIVSPDKLEVRHA